MPLPPGFQPPRVALLSAIELMHLLWVSASMTAMARHTDSLSISPGAGVKIVEGISALMSLSPLVAGYRYAKRGTIRIERTELHEARLDPSAFARTRSQLYGDMCNNLCNVYIPRGPAAVKQYIDHVVMVGRGAQESLKQFFNELRALNTENSDAIDRYRRDVYAVKVSAELTMVLLGAGPIPLLTQLGVGVGYTIVTNVITEWAGMQHADMVAMPAQWGASNTASVLGNVAQDVVDQTSEEWILFERARQRAFLSQQADIGRKIAKILEKGPPKGADKNLLRALRAELEAISQKMVQTSGGTAVASGVARSQVRVGGILVGLYFMREDLQNVLSYATHGDL
jgi:nucleotide-binding universal stress UspA family protein